MLPCNPVYFMKIYSCGHVYKNIYKERMRIISIMEHINTKQTPTEAVYEVADFLDATDRTASTKRSYLFSLRKYAECMATDLKTIRENAEDLEDENARKSKRDLKDKFARFRRCLTDAGLSPSTINVIMTHVRTFYKHYDINLPSMNKKKTRSQVIFSEILTKEEIRRILDVANPMEKAIITLMASNGMRQSDIRDLTLKDFLKAINIPSETIESTPFDIGGVVDLWDGDVAMWEKIDRKTNNYFITFSTPESVKYIFRYLQTNQPATINDALFKPQKNPNRRLDYLSEHTFGKMIRRLNERAGFDKGHFHSHKLRKYFDTTLTNAGLPSKFVDWMLAHKPGDVEGRYKAPNPNALKECYKEHAEKLTFMESIETRILTDEKLQTLEEENRKLRRDLEKLTIMVERGLKPAPWDKLDGSEPDDY